MLNINHGPSGSLFRKGILHNRFIVFIAVAILYLGCHSGECFSPTRNVEIAYEKGAKGCACDALVDKGVCVQDAALVCEEDNRWHAVMDGPCFSEVAPLEPDGGLPPDDRDSGDDAGSDAENVDARQRVECLVSQECTLVPKGCCGSCTPDKERVLAVPTQDAESVRRQQCPQPVGCGPCKTEVANPMMPELRAGCDSGRCVVVDLREQKISACERDDECDLLGRGCCGGCGGNPTGWLALRKSEVDPNPIVCDPISPCVACIDTVRPLAFCAEDKHCAVREAATVDGVPSAHCFSPWQAIESAYLSDAEGCDCYAYGAGICVADSSGRLVALMCLNPSWTLADDGTCDN